MFSSSVISTLILGRDADASFSEMSADRRADLELSRVALKLKMETINAIVAITIAGLIASALSILNIHDYLPMRPGDAKA